MTNLAEKRFKKLFAEFFNTIGQYRTFGIVLATMFVESVFSTHSLIGPMFDQNLRREAEVCRRLARDYRGQPEEKFLLSAARAFALLATGSGGKF